MLGAGLAGYGLATGLVRLRLQAPPETLMRTNVSGLRVPAVLGGPLVLSALAALTGVAVLGARGWEPAEVGRIGGCVAAVLAVMWLAGVLDDRRGDEGARGFKGHLRALGRGRLTGGLLKIAAGAVAGAVAGLVLFPHSPSDGIATMLMVALGANAINLLDRAPGRAAKTVLLVATPLMAFGDVQWAVASAGAMGALVAALPFDLGEKAMLGDAGANPLGGLVGLGLALSLDPVARWVAVAVLLALNVASERWSFSALIGSRPWLERLDRMGRK